MRVRSIILIAILLESATAFAQPGEPWSEPVTESYRHQTLVVDGIGLALLVAGGLSEGEGGRDTAASEALFTAGGLTMLVGAPLVHGIRGHRGRAAGSALMRAGLASAGMFVAVSINRGCDGLLCELDYVGYGVLGGLALATLLDAAYLTDETVETQWSPQLAATTDGVRAGVAFAW
jgi:hypothetical protein